MTVRIRPAKPRPDFPLYPHQSGRWAKKIQGVTEYFGPWEDPDGALAKWMRHAKSKGLQADVETMTLRFLLDRFLDHKKALQAVGECADRTVEWYECTARFLTQVFGSDREIETLTVQDFEALRMKMAERWGPIPLANRIQSVRTIFSYAFESGFITQPMRYGPGFKKPKAKVIRLQRASRGPQLYTPDQIQTLLLVSPANFRAMILLAINGGLGPHDLAVMPITAVDQSTGWLNFPRPKTGMPRRIPLWPRTLEAIKGALLVRPTPRNPDHNHLLFIGVRRGDYSGRNGGNRITGEIRCHLKKAQITGRTFYDFRRTFQTVGEELADFVAVQHIMGHAPSSGDMSAIYRQRIEDSRLKAVCNHVHKWVFGVPAWEGLSTPSSA